MATNFLFYFLIGLGFVLLIDLYCFKALSLFTKSVQPRLRTFFFMLNWAIVAVFLFGIIIILVFPATKPSDESYGYFMLIISFLYLIYLPKILFVIFHLLDDVLYVIIYLINTIRNIQPKKRKLVWSKIGASLALLLIGIMVYGMVWGKFDYQVNKVDITSTKIPASFEGYKIALFSDFHAGSMENHKDKVLKGFDLLMKEKPDAIFFAGDMVNHFSMELNGWNSVFSTLNAPDGKFSILGNHDYGDYIDWPDSIQKQKDKTDLIAFQDSFGFKLLRNEHTILKRGEDSIYLAGVENYGMPPFKRYGDLKKALVGIDSLACILLLSHDPKHWDQEIKQNPSIVLTMSGHTHAMQFGIDWHGFLWSPAQYIFKQWYGLYCESGSYLYVNRGFGYLAFPGRVGMRPEITILTLRHQ